MSDPLETYLQDHLGGARVAIELLQAMRNRNDQPLKKLAEHLLPEIEADRDLLQGIAEKIDGGTNVLKEVTGWVSEKATRVKLGQTSGDEFSAFQTLEFLALGVLGKVALWRALDVAAVSDERLRGYDFEHLVTRAGEQHAEIERRRLESAEKAFKPAH